MVTVCMNSDIHEVEDKGDSGLWARGLWVFFVALDHELGNFFYLGLFIFRPIHNKFKKKNCTNGDSNAKNPCKTKEFGAPLDSEFLLV